MKNAQTFLLISALFAASGFAMETPSPRELHQKHCLACHSPALYTRPERGIHSKPALIDQVRLCQGRQNLEWSDATIRAVADYLDTSYYRFGK